MKNASEQTAGAKALRASSTEGDLGCHRGKGQQSQARRLCINVGWCLLAQLVLAAVILGILLFTRDRHKLTTLQLTQNHRGGRHPSTNNSSRQVARDSLNQRELQPVTFKKAMVNFNKVVSRLGKAAQPGIQLRSDEFTKKPRNDKRLYQYSLLPNGLEVLNVQDNSTKNVGMAVAVMAGSFDDPEDLPGLAHFCEHMLFLGTGSYPDPAGFDDFVKQHGGYKNAYTAYETTVYFIEQSAKDISEGEDRFADFFRAPLFKSDSVEHEVNAINSEHAKNVQAPTWRNLQVLYSLASPKSPVSRFHTGDKGTLFSKPKERKVDIVEQLKAYFDKNYCPARMRLVVFSNEDLDKQYEGVRAAFGNFTGRACAKSGARKSWGEPKAFPQGKMSKWVNVVGTTASAEIWIHFYLKDIQKEYQSQPMSYLNWVLSYKGVDSISLVLKENLGLVNDFRLMADQSSAGTSLFLIMSLTKAGQLHKDVLLEVLFAYLGALHNSGVDERLYASLRAVGRNSWEWANSAGASSTASDLAERMTRLPPSEVLIGDAVIQKPNPQLVNSLLRQMTPDRMNVAFIAPASTNQSTLFEGQEVQQLPYYNVAHSVRSLAKVYPGALKRWNSLLSMKPKALRDALAYQIKQSGLECSGTCLPVVPGAIEGVPEEIPLDFMEATRVGGSMLEELYGERPRKYPYYAPKPGSQFLHDERLDRSESGEIWYRKGWMTTSPKVYIEIWVQPFISVKAPETSELDRLRLVLYAKLLSAAMVPHMVDLTATGVFYSVGASSGGVTFHFFGFPPVIPRLMEKVLTLFNDFNQNLSSTPPRRFEDIKQDYKDDLKSHSQMPYHYAITARNTLLQKATYSREETLAVIDQVTLESAASAVNDLVFSHRVWLTSLAMGNIEKDAAMSNISRFVQGIALPSDPRSLRSETDTELERVVPIIKPARPVELRKANPRVGDPNDVTVLTYLAGVSTIQSRVELGIISQLLDTVTFTELRTVRQLGYVVNSGVVQLSNVQYISVVVQGNVKSADEMEADMEYVLSVVMPRRLQNLTDREYETYKDSFRESLTRPPITYTQEVSHFWSSISMHADCFDLKSEMVGYLNSTLGGKESLIDAWDRVILSPHEGMGGTRRKMVMKFFHGDESALPARPALETFKSNWQAAGIDNDHAEMLKKEFMNTEVLGESNSKIRAKIMNEGGFFGKELYCARALTTVDKANMTQLRAIDPLVPMLHNWAPRKGHGQLQFNKHANKNHKLRGPKGKHSLVPW